MFMFLDSLWNQLDWLCGLSASKQRGHGFGEANSKPALLLERLEDRTCPTISFSFDYSLDNSGFFQDARPRQILELAGQIIGSHLNDQLSAIIPDATHSWTATFYNPSTGALMSEPNLTVRANTLVIFVGGHNYTPGTGGSLLGEGGYGGFDTMTATDWATTVADRGQTGAEQSRPTDFGPWGGSVTFDTGKNWYFGDLSGKPAANQTDFLSVAMHELTHLLGFGTAPSWQANVSGSQFIGASAKQAYNGQPVPLSPARDHWADNTQDPTQGLSDLTPVIAMGKRILLTNLDYAALHDIGWNSGPATPATQPGTQGSTSTTPTPPARATQFAAQTVGVMNPTTATWYLRSSNSAGAPDAGQFQYGSAGWKPVVGDWDGNGTDTVGIYDPNTARWYLRNSNTAGAPDAGSFQYGDSGWIPVVGDWDGNGTVTIGVFNPNTATWYLRNSNSAGAPDAGVIQFGERGWIPVAGDWDGSGRTEIGVFNQTNANWYLLSSLNGPSSVTHFQFGDFGWTPVVGDWDGNGSTTIGIVNPATSTWYLRNSNSAGTYDAGHFQYGIPGSIPLAGTWSKGSTPASTRAADHLFQAALDLNEEDGGNLPLVHRSLPRGCQCAYCQAATAQAVQGYEANQPTISLGTDLLANVPGTK